MDKRIIEQLELDLEEEFSINISAELEIQLKSLAEAHNMNGLSGWDVFAITWKKL